MPTIAQAEGERQPCPYLKKTGGVWRCFRPDAAFGVANQKDGLLCQDPGATKDQIETCANAISKSLTRRGRYGKGQRGRYTLASGPVGHDSTGHSGSNLRSIEKIITGKE